MRAHQILNEIAMNPNSLRAEAAKINAIAGMEFEMYVPNTAQVDDDYEQTQDYSDDQQANDIEDICSFFDDGEYNSRREVERLREKLLEDYYEWASEEKETQWQSEAKDEIRDYIDMNDWDDDEEIEQALDNMGLSKEEKAEAMSLTHKSDNWKHANRAASVALDERAEEELNDQGRIYEQVHEEWEENNEFPEQRDWLREQGITSMSDVENTYDITWPYWVSESVGGELGIDEVASNFSSMIGRKVNHGEYHTSKREPGVYNLEPDASLDDPHHGEDGGLEFISPPLPLVEMLSDLHKVKAWADATGCYTNTSTGLHINVSVPGTSEGKLDYVKLALLLGDTYVIDQFGRAGSSYCKSSLAEVKRAVTDDPTKISGILDQMRNGLNELASRAIHSGATSKYVSINNKEGYIEFRAPGDDWLSGNFNKIENTLLRCVVALDAACDPQKYRKEYLIKLYKALDVRTSNDPIAIFAKYAAGEFTNRSDPIQAKNLLTYLLKQSRDARARAKTPEVKHPGYKVTNTYYTSAESDILAPANRPDGITPSEAIAMARQRWGVYDEVSIPDSTFIVKPIAVDPGQSSTGWAVTLRSGRRVRIMMSDQTQAMQQAADYYPDDEVVSVLRATP